MAGGKGLKRIWIPVGFAVLLAAGVIWSFAAELTLRMAFLMGAVGLELIVAAIWWWFLSGTFRRRALVRGLAGLAIVIVAGKLTLRWDGSVNGATPFRLAWKWSPTKDAGLNDLAQEATPAAIPAEVPLPADLADSPRFLGPQGNGVVPDPGLATDWKANPPQELWRIRVGVGFSSFAVAGRCAVTQEQRQEAEWVTCCEVTTGRLLWAHRDPVHFSENLGGPGPRATPSIADGTVYAIGATGILNALDLKTGALRWSRNILREQGLNIQEYGGAASPLVDGDLVIVGCGTAGADSGKPVLFGFERKDGKLRWSHGPGPASYSSPVLMTLGGEAQVVAVLGAAVVGLEPASGALRWRFDWRGFQPKVAQPVQVAPNRLLITSAYGLPSHLLQISGGEVEPVWSKVQMKTKFSSAVAFDGYAYGLDEGKLVCMDLATGDRVWKGPRYGYGQNLLVGRLLLIQAESGEVVLCRPRPEGAEELSRIAPLQGTTWNAPALAGRYLLVRNDVEAVCLRLP